MVIIYKIKLINIVISAIIINVSDSDWNEECSGFKMMCVCVSFCMSVNST